MAGPGGPNRSIQFNNSNSFGGLATDTIDTDGTMHAPRLRLDNSGSDTIPLTIKTNGSVGNYTATNSGLFFYNAAGIETLRIVATDPNPSDYNGINLFIGAQAGNSNPSDNTSAGYYNVGVGLQSLFSNTTGTQNVAVGRDALYANTIGTSNNAFGDQALIANTTGGYNQGIGAYSLFYNTTGDSNTAVGNTSGWNPNNDIAQFQIVADTNMTLIGYGATKDNAATLTNGIAIGSGAHVLQSNQAVIGNTNLTSVVLHGVVSVTGDGSGIAGTTSLTNATNSTTTNAYTVKGGQAATTPNTGWLKLFVGTTVVWVPYWANATP